MTRRTNTTVSIVVATVWLAACGHASQAPGMDAKDLSDDRGARAGRFLSPAANDTDDAGPADNAATTESKP